MDKKDFKLLFEDDNIRVFYKPSGMHSVSQKISDDSAVSRYTRLYGTNKDVPGEDNGLLYRLDLVTDGLIAFAKTNDAYQVLFRTGFLKKYRAISHSTFKPLVGIYDKDGYEHLKDKLDREKHLIFESYFRSYESNSAFVRPVLKEQLEHFKNKKVSADTYSTEIKKISDSEFECMIRRGHRHQIRATLSSLFYPIDGDINYGSQVVLDENNKIALTCKNIVGEFNNNNYDLDLDKL